MKRKITIIFLLLPFIINAQYTIKGTLAEKGDWQYAHFQYIPSLDDLTAANMNQVIQSVKIDSMGHFEISGIGLPEGEHLYMLLLGENSIENGGFGITNGLIKNYLYLILDEPIDIELDCPDVSVTLVGCGFWQSPQSASLAHLTDGIIPTMIGHAIKSGVAPEETGRQFFLQKMDSELKKFADTCQYLLPALVALEKMNGLETDFKNDPIFYEKFLQRLQPILKTSPYAIEFATRVESWQRVYFGEKKESDRSVWLPIFMALSGLLLGYIFYLRKQLWALKTQAISEKEVDPKVLGSLSPKELEVFQLMAGGKSNKEIAQALFIETNTVKSHVNKIYQKLGIRSRREVGQWRNLL